MKLQFMFKSLTIGLVLSAGSFLSAPAFAQSQPSAERLPGEQSLAQASNTIVDIAAGNDNFDTLVQAVQAAELANTLSGQGPYTVFAPTDDAFAALPDGVLEALLEPENKDLLTEVLTYHVVSGEVPSDQLETGTVDSLNGALNVNVAPNSVTVNDARVTQPDIDASNGVIHVIDKVLVPQTTSAELVRRIQTAQTQTTQTEATRTQTTQTTRTTQTTQTPRTTSPQPQATQSAPVRGLW